jgi:hypothetical protein
MASRDKLTAGREDTNSQWQAPAVMASIDTPTTGRDGHRQAGGKLKQGRLAGIDPWQAGTARVG